jgi:hypothetical protein
VDSSPAKQLKSLPTIACAIVITVCAAGYIKANLLSPMGHLSNASDFTAYHRAAKAVLHGQSPYENPAYFYPPVVAFLTAPFGLTDYVTARWIWFALSQVFLLSAAWLLWRASGRSRIALCCIAGVWAFGGAARESLNVGQMGPLLVFLIAIALSQRERLQEAAVGIGFVLKYIPGVLSIALILNRRRALLTLAWVVALGTILPWAVLFWAFPGAKTPTSANYWMGTPDMFSWSIPSLLLRLLDPLAPGASLPQNWLFGHEAAELHLAPTLRWISLSTAIATLGAGIVALLLVCRGRLSGRQVPWAMAGLVSLSLAASPVCWTHYQILQYPGVALLLADSIRRRAWGMLAAVSACFGLAYQLPQAVLTAYHDQHSGWTTASPALLYIWTSVAPLACVALFGVALWKVRHSGIEKPSSVSTEALAIAESPVAVAGPRS